MQFRRISILGVGLLGGSLGLAARNAISGCEVYGYGHRRSTLDAALARGAITHAFDKPGLAVDGADLVVLCTPVGLFEELLTDVSPHLMPDALITDVGSTKASVVQAAARILPSTVEFVGSHPMAGSEKRGVEHADANLFRGALCILTPTEKTDRKALQTADRFWQLLGMRTTQMSPADHDRFVCDISHLPHAIAAALVAMQDDHALELAGKGFLDATRIAGGDGGLWRDILVDNRQNLRASLARLDQTIQQMLTALDSSNPEDLKHWLNTAAQRRAGIRRLG